MIACGKKEEPIIITPGVVDAKLTEGLQTGAVDLFKQAVRTEDAAKNVVISPLGIQYAVGMAANGASGATLDEMMKLFGTTSDQLKNVNSNLKGLKTNLIGSSKDYTLGISNGIFFDPFKYQMAAQYKANLTEAYNPKFQELNFAQEDASLKTINDWVATSTEQRIKKVLENIQENEFMFLINALYMKATWVNPFAPEATFEVDFTDSKSETHRVQLMNQRKDIAYYKTEDEKAIVMPLGEGKLEAIFILPQKSNVIDYIGQLDNGKLKKMIANAVAQDLMIGLPKTEMLLNYDLKQIMKDMGIETAFSDSADFTKMGTASNKILLTRALHDVFLKMDEKGIEGAAVTTIGVGVTSMPEYVGFDKPFVMVVYDKTTGTYVFMGKIEKP